MNVLTVGRGIEKPDEEGRKHLWSHSESNLSKFSRSLDDADSQFMLPYYLKPRETPSRKILTISTVQLHRAINDRIQDDAEMNYYNRDMSSKKSESKKSSLPEVFPFDKPKKKVVGGGGIIAKFESPFRYRTGQYNKSNIEKIN